MSAGSKKPLRGLSRRVFALGVGMAFAAVMLELGCWLVTATGLISARVPSYSLAAGSAGFWGDLDPGFGAWHPPNTRYLHQKACFRVVYESNSYGARDRERSRDSDAQRVVVLGDSFMEGFGVAAEDRLSDVLEADTGTPHLNFGSSGNTGPTHAFALYTHLASGFRHDAVLASILPENDFDDDVPKPDRYQPYWEGRYPDLELRYSLSSVEDSKYRCDTSAAEVSFGRALREFTYSKNVLDFAYSAFKQWRYARRLEASAEGPTSRFFRFSQEEFERLRHSYEQLAAAAAPRPVVLFTIPRHADFAACGPDGRNPLDAALAEWAAGVDNIWFVPLLPALRARFEGALGDQFLPCDAHWGPAGHAAAAAVLRDAVGSVIYGG